MLCCQCANIKDMGRFLWMLDGKEQFVVCKLELRKKLSYHTPLRLQILPFFDSHPFQPISISHLCRVYQVSWRSLVLHRARNCYKL